MKTIRAILFLLIVPVLLTAQDMSSNVQRSLFADYKANRVGDAITILVVESSQASNQAEKSAGRSSDVGLSANGQVGDNGIPEVDFGISSGNDFRGSGSTRTTGMVKTRISATIDSVYANGNLRIHGNRRIVINGEEQEVSISGIVRSLDIAGDNTVYSYNISDAEIVFEGSGLISRSQNPGWLTKIFHWLF